MSAYTRRLPIYLLLDCSESMAGDAIDELGRGVETMLAALRADPMAVESAYLSVITFARTAKQVVPLTEVMQFQPPQLLVGTGTAMGGALRLVRQCIDREVVKTTPNTKGDYKALVILFTDGEPTDEWEAVAEEFKASRSSIANLYAIACGPDADTDTLRELTDIVLRMKDMSPQAWRKVFVWLSASVQTTSQALERGGEGDSHALPALPEDVLEVAPMEMEYNDGRPRQVFLRGRCSKDGRAYIMRFARRPHGETYVPLGAHILDGKEEKGGRDTSESVPSVTSAMLEGMPQCPYCENPLVVNCICGTLFCASNNPEENHTCPSCKTSGPLAPASPEPFDVRRAKG
ncbi:MAG: VWA domain-containing protein [Planctomycetes bacterium]|nr:VWA domain-containing protein [Planctomycetota bacterium]